MAGTSSAYLYARGVAPGCRPHRALDSAPGAFLAAGGGNGMSLART